jgi:hypothetical protein
MGHLRRSIETSHSFGADRLSSKSRDAGVMWEWRGDCRAANVEILTSVRQLPISAMSNEPRNSTKTQLALADAQGLPVADWARTTAVPRRTAFQWANDGCARRSSLIGAAPHYRTERLWVERTFAERKAKHGIGPNGALGLSFSSPGNAGDVSAQVSGCQIPGVRL